MNPRRVLVVKVFRCFSMKVSVGGGGGVGEDCALG